LIRSLGLKLGLALLALLLVLGAAHLALTARTARLYALEVQQRLNRDTARHIAEATELFQGGEVNRDGLKDLFMKAMAVNPTLEIYLLDEGGAILGFDAPPEKIVRERVSLEPLLELTRATSDSLVLGDDPRDASRQKVFSAWPVETGGRRGWVYAILASEEYESIARMTRRSQILRRSVWIGLLAVTVAGCCGLLIFALLTRPLRQLRQSVERFHGVDPDTRAAVTSDDEIGALAAEFNRMADRIGLQMRRIRRNDRNRREMVASISHDLRTPLASLQGYLETCLMKADDSAPEQLRGYLESAMRNGERLKRLVEDLFQLSRLEAGEIQVAFEPFSLGELAQDALQKFALAAERRGVALRAEIPADLPPVGGDIGLIERALDNLVENALRYTPPGGTVKVALLRHQAGVELRVVDTGAGIPAEELPRVFDRFYRVEKSRGDDGGGAGLGLAITRRIVELHRSTIEARSQVGRGTLFRFRLAAAGAGTADPPAAAPAA